MSYTSQPLPVPGPAASSIWARRMITKAVPATDSEVELNVLSLLLDVPLASLDENDLATSPVSLHSPISPWTPVSNAPGVANIGELGSYRSPSPAPIVQRSKSMDYYQDGYHTLEMHTAQTAVKAALDVLEEPSLNRGLGISTAVNQPQEPALLSMRGCLTAPLSPVSPAESCFSSTEAEGTKKKGRARMSQEKRKRLARRREREALVAVLTQQPSQNGAADVPQYLSQQSQHAAAQFSHSAPTTPPRNQFAQTAFGGFPFSSNSTTHSSYEPFSTPLSSPRSVLGFELPSPALTNTSLATSSHFGSIDTPSSSPSALASTMGEASPPTLVVQPPSPQRLRNSGLMSRVIAPPQNKPSPAPTNQCWSGFATSRLASVF